MKRKLIGLMLMAPLLMAPTVGDVGGCGASAQLLDPAAYAETRKDADCERCLDCALSTDRCRRACDPKVRPEIVLPDSCKPLVHDGEVCIHALRAASCSAFAEYVDDVAPSTPSECAFCLVPPDAGPQVLFDAQSVGTDEASAAASSGALSSGVCRLRHDAGHARGLR